MGCFLNMNKNNRAAVTALTNFISTQLPFWYGKGAVLDLERLAMQIFPYSFFLSVPILNDAGEQTLLIKIKRQPDVSSIADAIGIERLKAPAENEYSMMEKIWDVFSSENITSCAAVKPVAYLGQWNAVLMEKFEGRALKNFSLSPYMLFRFPMAQASLKEFVASSARWLRIFHERVSDMKNIPFPVGAIWSDIEEGLERLELYSNGHLDIMTYRDIFEVAMNKVAHFEVPFGVVHDDYHYSNILVNTEGQVCVIDHAGDYRTCAYVDLATLITDPQTRTWQIMANGFYIPSSFIQELRTTILENYFSDSGYSLELIDFFCAIAVLNKWSEGLARFSVQRRRPSVFFLKRLEKYFSKHLNKYLSYVM